MSRVKNKKRSYFLPKLVVIVLAVLLLTGIAAAYFPGMFFGAADSFVDISAEDQRPGGSFLDRFSRGKINIVVLGFDSYDSRKGEQSLARPDSIIVASFDPRKPKVSMVSIPRDSFVRVHGTDTYDKINHSYMHGYYQAAEGEDPFEKALQTTLLTVRDFLGGVPLHGYIKLDMAGAEDIVDSIGGIYHHVEFDVRDDFGRGRVLVEEGYQRLDGKQFLDYVRNRADAQGGDLGRARRQQEMMIVLLDQITEPRGLVRIPALYRAVTGSVDMDLNKLQLAALGLCGLRMDPSEIETHVFDGRGQLSYRGGQNIYYLVINEENRVDLIEKIFGVRVEKRAMPVLEGPLTEEEPEEPEPEPEPEPDPETETEPEPETEPGEEEPVKEDPLEDEEAPSGEEPAEEDNGEEKEPLDEEQEEKEGPESSNEEDGSTEEEDMETDKEDDTE